MFDPATAPSILPTLRSVGIALAVSALAAACSAEGSNDPGADILPNDPTSQEEPKYKGSDAGAKKEAGTATNNTQPGRDAGTNNAPRDAGTNRDAGRTTTDAGRVNDSGATNQPDASVIIDAGNTADAGLCGDLAPPNMAADCRACGTRPCQANGCYGGYYCNILTDRCTPKPSTCP